MDHKGLSIQKKAIMKNFDFEKVEKVMNFLDWTWYIAAKVPTLQEIKDEAAYLMDDAIKRYMTTKGKAPIQVGLGGFVVRINNHDGLAVLELDFVLSSWNGADFFSDAELFKALFKD